PIHDGGIVVKDGMIHEIGRFADLSKSGLEVHHIETPVVALPGLIDCHTHLCYAGSRAHDYALRLEGKSYQEIAKSGGGILDTVAKTRAASTTELKNLLLQRTQRLLKLGITTCEVKSGYGLSIAEEIRHLQIISEVANLQPVTLISTCLAAHMR